MNFDILISGAITRLYTDHTPPARALRHVALRIGERLTPFKRIVAASLADGR